ncbi:MAG TPA: hypothetical protein VN918_02630 [Myxococcaceae bacterium]|nr:hypothetical protein [Myxococcaceae bacterium]
MWRPSLILLALTWTSLACIVEAPSSEKGQARRTPGAQTPPLSVPVGANLGNRVELEKTTIQPGQISPGDQVKVTLSLKVLDGLEKDYVIFVHVEDPDGRMERMNVDHRPAGGNYPSSMWKKGETIKDEFHVYLPPGARPHALNLWVGFWDPVTDTRLPLENPQAVRNDGKNRVLIARIPVGE